MCFTVGERFTPFFHSSPGVRIGEVDQARALFTDDRTLLAAAGDNAGAAARSGVTFAGYDTARAAGRRCCRRRRR